MKKKILWALVIIIAFIFIDVIVLDAYLDKNVDNAQIEKVLNEYCDCTVIKKGLNAKGLSLKNSVYGDYHSFRLTNCRFNNFEEYVEGLHKKLQDSIHNFCEADLVELRFETASKPDKIINIRDCVLTFK